MSENKIAVLEVCQNGNQFRYLSNIEDAASQANLDIEVLTETIDSVNALKPQCDKLDYTLSACSGALCGIIDIFLVGIPGKSTLGKPIDGGIGTLTMEFAKRDNWIINKINWIRQKIFKFAEISRWKPVATPKLENAIKWLEERYKVPYDQTSVSEATRWVLGLNTSSTTHHFESLGHNPTLLGLFFSIIDQFANTSHFVLDGQLVTLYEDGDKFKLEGRNFVSKIFCGLWNWIGHLISDVSGSYKSEHKGNRGMGIPSPIWAWINDIIVIRRKLGIEESDFDISLNKMAVEVFNKGFDTRFQTTQCIPVFINELVVRMFYTIRRTLHYFSNTTKGQRSFKDIWSKCKPFGNVTISRMLTVAHGTFCLVDITDATIRGFVTGGGYFNPVAFFLSLNVAGVGRFTISLYGETKRAINLHIAEKEADYAKREKTIIEYYMDGLNILKVKYDDKEYLAFVNDLQNNDYIKAFSKTASLAKLRGVPDDKVLTTKIEIDKYFKN